MIEIKNWKLFIDDSDKDMVRALKDYCTPNFTTLSCAEPTHGIRVDATDVAAKAFAEGWHQAKAHKPREEFQVGTLISTNA